MELFAAGLLALLSLRHNEPLALTTRIKTRVLHDGIFIIKRKRLPIHNEIFHGSKRTSLLQNIKFIVARAYFYGNMPTGSSVG